MSNKQLHITNGDSTVLLMEAAALPGTYLAWHDVLHDGPVPPLPLAALSRVRAQFICRRGWGSLTDVLARFHHRDELLARQADYDEVVLWFEHDLYDQLQLIQLLDWFAQQPARGALMLICIGEFPGVPEFHGLGVLQPDQLASLWDRREAVRPSQLALAQVAWAALQKPDPAHLCALLRTDLTSLPFLAAALRRLLQEYPAVEDGLGRVQRTTLATLRTAPCSPVELFRASQASEPARYLGDWSYWRYLERLALAALPLVVNQRGAFVRHDARAGPAQPFFDQLLSLTATGAAVLAGTADQIELNGIDEWRGGVHLRTERHWRWQERDGRLLPWAC